METQPTGLEEASSINDKSWKRGLGLRLGWGAVLVAIMTSILALIWNTRHPNSEDAVVSAPVIGIAPRVSGPIRNLPIADNELVPEGGVLFEIDPEPYKLAVDAAAANLAVADGELQNALRLIESQQQQVNAAGAALKKAETAFAEASETYERLEPLLSKRYASPEQVNAARRAQESAAAGVVAAKAELLAAQSSVQNIAPLTARREAVAATLAIAQLALKDCTVRAPFPARVAGMSLARGAFARIGIDVFTLIDTRHWSVNAVFREGEMRQIKTGQHAMVELMTAPGKKFEGVVESTGYGVTPLPKDPFPGLPIVPRELDWVRLAQKFPVKIRLPSDIPQDFLRVGATASATILP